MGVGWRRKQRRGLLVTNYFSQHFRTSVVDGGVHMQQLLDAVQSGVTPGMNDMLTKEFAHEEIKAVLDAIGDLKAVGDQMVKEVMEVLQGDHFPEG